LPATMAPGWMSLADRMNRRVCRNETRARLACSGPWSYQRTPGVAYTQEIGMSSKPRPSYDRIPDVRDGLTRIERVILFVLEQTEDELGGRNVPTAMLYGRVVEHVNISVDEFQRTLARLVGR
ncbi:MAG TPA: hypothetical protein PKA58_31365, partial [Polyangium sp.]|nr:hypothetical protein [Polyangium sp.]